MNLEDLRAAQTRERATDGLQELRDSFYVDVAAYIEELKGQREAAAAAADDPFGDPEVQELTDKIETAEQVTEAIYERRMGKLVKQASLAAAGMPDDVNGLTDEERDLYGDLVARIESNKSHVLDVIAGDAEPDSGDEPAGNNAATDASNRGTAGTAHDESTASRASESAKRSSDGQSDDASAAAAMGSGLDATGESAEAGESSAVTGDDPPATGDDPPSETGSDATNSDRTSATAEPTEAIAKDLAEVQGSPGDADETDAESRDSARESDDGDEDVNRTTVRVTDDVGEIFGMDEREYTLEAEDVVTLPEENAEPLVEKGAAEKLE